MITRISLYNIKQKQNQSKTVIAEKWMEMDESILTQIPKSICQRYFLLNLTKNTIQCTMKEEAKVLES